MAKRNDRANSNTAEVDQAETELRAVQALAKKFEDAEKSAKEALYSALEGLFEFVERHRTTKDGINILKALVQQNDGRWGKIAEENPYQPFVKLAFPNRSDAAHSQYGKVLAFAHDTLTGPEAKKLPAWLGSFSDGLDGAYQAAVQHFAEPSEAAKKQTMRVTRLNMARAKLANIKKSADFSFNEPVGVQDGYVMALVRIGSKSDAYIVDVVEKDQQRIEETLLGYVKEVEAEISVLKGKKLFELYRAVHLLDGLASPGVKANNRLLLITNRSPDKGKAQMTVASTAYNSPWASIELASPLPKLPAGQMFAINEKNASQFRKQFGADGEWSLLAPPSGKTEYRLSSSGEGTDEVAIAPFEKSTDTQYFVGDVPTARSRPFLLTYDAMESFLRQIKGLEQNAKKERKEGDPPVKMPKLLSLKWQSKLLRGAPLGTLGPSYPLLDMPDNPGQLTDRYLGIDDFSCVCRTLIPYGVDVQGWLVDTEERHGALLLRHDFDGDVFTALIPLMTSTDMHYAKMCKPLQDGATA